MSLSIGIVGLPNVGKSTLFNTLTKKKVDISNYPFCTIDPNVGIVHVPDERLAKLAKVSSSEEIIPTVIEFVDIAGLVKGANKGEGLGNQFLSRIRECDAICEVIRSFKDLNVIHVDGKVNPKGDSETINTELLLADLSMLEKILKKAEKSAKSGDKGILKQKDLLLKIKKDLEDGNPIRDIELANEEEEAIRQYNFLTAKPIIYVLNVGESETKNEAEWLKDAVCLNVKLENEIMNFSEKEQKEYISELGLKESGPDKLIKASYKLLQLITFFTTGPKETRAWTVKAGATAPEAAGRIHSDIEEGFIRAEVVNWKKLIEAQGEAKAKEKGLIKTEGKNYIVKDGDVCFFLFK